MGSRDQSEHGSRCSSPCPQSGPPAAAEVRFKPAGAVPGRRICAPGAQQPTALALAIRDAACSAMCSVAVARSAVLRRGARSRGLADRRGAQRGQRGCGGPPRGVALSRGGGWRDAAGGERVGHHRGRVERCLHRTRRGRRSRGGLGACGRRRQRRGAGVAGARHPRPPSRVSPPGPRELGAERAPRGRRPASRTGG